MVEFILENETDEEISEQQINELNRVCCEIMKNEECNFDAEISFTFTDNEGIREINRDYRNIDRPTDVLSFPMLEFCDDETDVEYETENGLVLLGDIVISIERAKEQAQEFGHSLRRELAFLTAHSMLHLLGYDHVDDPVGEKMMIEKQDIALNALGITRD
ncbi:MAG: rRNA maturation RNase YbeY [Clostridiales bacterium]|nr:rRNA maturation RNase YbeY [Clostridiales bacterium]